VPHPCAFCAQGWDSTVMSSLGLPSHSRTRNYTETRFALESRGTPEKKLQKITPFYQAVPSMSRKGCLGEDV
jgi:hypothetical protein